MAGQLFGMAQNKMLSFSLNKFDCTQILTAFRKVRDLHAAQRVLTFMCTNSIPTDAHVYATFFSLCAEMRNFEIGSQALNQLRDSQIEMNSTLLNSILNMFLQCGKPKEALIEWEKFCKMVIPDCKTYFQLVIAAAAIGGGNFEVVNTTLKMIENDIRIIRDSLLESSLDITKFIYYEQDILRLDANILISIFTMVDYSTAKHIHNIVAVPQVRGAQLLRLGPKIYTAIFNMYRRHEMHHEGVTLWQVRANDTPIDAIMCTSFLQIACDLGDVNLVDSVKFAIDKKLSHMDAALLTMLVHAYSKCDPEKAVLLGNLERQLAKGDIKFYSSLLVACGKTSNLKLGIKLHDELKATAKSWDNILWNSLASMYLKCDSPLQIRALWDERMLMNEEIPEIFITTALAAAIQLRDITFGELVHTYILSNKLRITTSIGNNLLNMYLECGNNPKALRIWEHLRDFGAPDLYTYTLALTACANLVAIRQGKEVYEHFIQSGLETNAFLDTALLNMYSQTGNIARAVSVFTQMKKRAELRGETLSVVSYNAMLAAYSHHGLGQECISLFTDMQQRSVQPTAPTFASILIGCSHNGLVEEGFHFFDLMERFYAIKPSIEHYNCVVDLLGRANRIPEAEIFISEKIRNPNLVTWRALMGACRVHKNVEVAKRALEKLEKLDPLDSSQYVLMSNIHAAAGEFAEARRIRDKMARRGIKKTPGVSSAEVEGVTHTFYAHETRHPEMPSIFAEIKKMQKEARVAGFVQNVDCVVHEVEDDVKKEMLWYHSEKLAIAYALLKRPTHTPIVVHKNLRICEDCHETAKFISRVRQREIYVRDATRWHHFTQGTCSCGDFY